MSSRPAEPTRLLPGLWLFEDTCNVYVLQSGEEAVLVDFGSGAVLEHLGSMGVSRVAWVLHTHHHRDQCQGDRLANDAGIPIAVPAHERHLFDEVESFWDMRPVYNMYNLRSSTFTLGRSVQTAAVLCDYQRFEAGPFSVTVIPTPGHTMGHVALGVEVSGRRVVFSGDLLHHPEHVQNLYDLQWRYDSEDGLVATAWSLRRVMEHGPDLACPSHGPVLENPIDACQGLDRKVRSFLDQQRGLASLAFDTPPVAVLPHLVYLEGMANSWIVVSDSGNAMVVDLGFPDWYLVNSVWGAWEPGDRTRPLLHDLSALCQQHGISSFDVAIPSHYHDDHIGGFPHLQREYGTKVWAFENMVDILEHPHGYKLGCVAHEPLRIDRAVAQGETIRWEEFEFQVFHAPGHTDYHMAMFGEIDGKRVAFSGDNVMRRTNGQLGNSFVPRNHLHANDHLTTARLFLEQEPELACSGHNPPLWLDRGDWEEFEDWSRNETRHWAALSPRGDIESAVFSDSVTVYPYQAPCGPGQQTAMQVRVTNTGDEPLHLEFALIPPSQCEVEPSDGVITANPGERVAFGFVLRAGSGVSTRHRRAPLLLDARVNGRHRGQIAEAIVDLRPELDWGSPTRRRSVADA